MTSWLWFGWPRHHLWFKAYDLCRWVQYRDKRRRRYWYWLQDRAVTLEEWIGDHLWPDDAVVTFKAAKDA